MASFASVKVPEHLNFPKMEEEILAFWKDIDAFQECLRRSKAEKRPEFSFSDGPPFATGLPHYGHILAGTIKDVVTRYAHMTGHHVERRFGWDCHGLPIEFEIDKLHGVKTTDDVLKMGIDKYNEACRAIVMKYASEWRSTVTRMGRWIDFDNDYKTMNLDYMESVWWVVKQLWKKGFIYSGFKVMPYSTACATPLSNFEVGQNYKDTKDPSIVVSFPLVDRPDVSFLVWTTTPWTLPSNVALCVNPEMDYVEVQDLAKKTTYILSAGRLSFVFKKESDYKILTTMKGKDLLGVKYVPLFDYFVADYPNGFRVVMDGYVKEGSGTGVVHQAPAFGEDDYRVCKEHGIIVNGGPLPMPIDSNARFVAPVVEWQGLNVKEADKGIKQAIIKKGRMVINADIVHSYPFCWRSDTPLIYRAVPSWFIAVEKVKEQLLANNAATHWVPSTVKEKRFHNWLSDARDWCFSRNRYWGTPLPIWTCVDDPTEKPICIGSVAKLKKHTGATDVTDIHRHHIDHLEIKRNGKTYRRVTEVLDCWFESGSMPYASVHYPFSCSEDAFQSRFPADFIAEGIDQTRGWFYTLMVLGTMLKGSAPFKNVIVNGIVLASDGQKMSKSKKNYPSPLLIVDNFGADALRMYLINSPVVHGESLRFSEKAVQQTLFAVFLPWFNSFRFFVQNAASLPSFSHSLALVSSEQFRSSLALMDRWILSATQSLVRFIRAEMTQYKLYTTIPRLLAFIDSLTNGYVRFNRKRIRGAQGPAEQAAALSTLFEVLLTLSRCMAPLTPFFTEHLYQTLRLALPESEREPSVHMLSFPTVNEALLAPEIEAKVDCMRRVIEFGRAARVAKLLSVKQPLLTLTVIHPSPAVHAHLTELQSYILSEVNVRQLIVTADKSLCRSSLTPSHEIGKRLKGAREAVCAAIRALSPEKIEELLAKGELEVAGHIVYRSDVTETRTAAAGESVSAVGDSEFVVLLDTTVTESLREEGLAREVVNRIQKMRKAAGITPTDPVDVYWTGATGTMGAVLERQRQYVTKQIGIPFFPATCQPPTQVLLRTEFTIHDMNVTLSLVVRHIGVRESAVAQLYNPAAAPASATVHTTTAAAWARSVHNAIVNLPVARYASLFGSTAATPSYPLTVDGLRVNLLVGTHLFPTPALANPQD